MYFNKKYLRRWSAPLLAFTILMGEGQTSRADEFDVLRNKWLEIVPATSNINPSDQDIKSYIERLTNSAQDIWSRMNKEENRTFLWAGDGYNKWEDDHYSPRSENYRSLKILATAYAMPGTNMNNPALAQDIIQALDWMYLNHYNERLNETGNWWDWQIGPLLNLSTVLLIMAPQLDPIQITNYQRVLDRFCPNAVDRLKPDGTPLLNYETGANLLDKAYIQAMRGILTKNGDRFTMARQAIARVLPYVTSKDGFYIDGSFIQHNNVGYAGAYGNVLMTDLGRLLLLFKDSAWELSANDTKNAFDWVEQSFRPFIYNGAMMGTVQGRGQGTESTQEHISGRAAITSLLNVAQSAPVDVSTKIKGYLKGWIIRDNYFSNYFGPAFTNDPNDMGLAPRDITSIKEILTDDSVAPAPELVRTHLFAAMDRAQIRHADFAYNITMSSTRIADYEWSNTQNLEPWWTGLGMTATYNGDIDQYDRGYFATVNRVRLPGTTTDGSKQPYVTGNPTFRLGMFPWVGGAILNKEFGSIGMQFGTQTITGTSLKGKKSWFLLGDKVVALGSDINSSDGREVETVVENRRLSPDGTNSLIVNGDTQPNLPGWSASLPQVSWAHLAGTTPKSDIGYFFPKASVIQGIRETRTGQWTQINTTGSNAPITNNFLSLAIKHGISPSGGTYAYAVLPNRTADEIARYSGQPDFKVLENSNDIHAVQDTSNNIIAANFWSNKSATLMINGLPYINTNKPAAFVTRMRGNELQIAIADPTMTNQTINVEIGRMAKQRIFDIGEDVDGITILQLSPSIKLTVNTKGWMGKSKTIKFTLSPTIRLYAKEDTFVWDGKANASTPNGSSGFITVKKDATGYNRTGYLKFDVNDVQPMIKKATLVMDAIARSGRPMVTHNAYLVADNSWSEGELTYLNQPSVSANATKIGSWSVDGIPHEIDITGIIKRVISEDNKLISIRIQDDGVGGNSTQVDYRSKESTVNTNRPTLVIEYSDQ